MKKSRGFTLIELLVVVSIIALLIALLLPQLAKAKEQTKLVKCGTNLHSIFISIGEYVGQNKDIMPSAGSFYRTDIMTVSGGTTPALLGWAEELMIDGDVAQKYSTNVGPATYGHYPAIKAGGIYACPNADPNLQFGNGPSSGEYSGYGLNGYSASYFQNTYQNGAAGSQMPNSADSNTKPWIVRMASLNPSKILAAEGYYNFGSAFGVYGGTTPTYGYWVYQRHFPHDNGTSATASLRYTGTSNYLFNDGHVETNASGPGNASGPYPTRSYYRDIPAKFTNINLSPWYSTY